MSDTKHTPGPWETSAIGHSKDSIQWDVYGPDAGDMIADLSNLPNAEANARLIAAAPQLYEALQRLCEPGRFCPEYEDKPEHLADLEAGREALKLVEDSDAD